MLPLGAAVGDIAVGGDGDVGGARRHRLEPALQGHAVAGDDAAVRRRSSTRRRGCRPGCRRAAALRRSRRPGWPRRAVRRCCVSSPVVKMREVATGREPWPIWRPVGSWLPAPCLGARGAGGLVKQILELDLALLEPGGVDVRQVVGDDVQVHLLGFHPGGGGVKCAQHMISRSKFSLHIRSGCPGRRSPCPCGRPAWRSCAGWPRTCAWR